MDAEYCSQYRLYALITSLFSLPANSGDNNKKFYYIY